MRDVSSFTTHYQPFNMVSSYGIAVIGGGNLGAAIAEGLYKSKLVAADQLWVSKRKTASLKRLQESGLNVTSSNAEAVRNARYIILAVKPKQVRMVLEEINSLLDPEQHVLISCATGISLKDMQSVVGVRLPLLRAMPNTAIAIRESMTCIATNNAPADVQEAVTDIFNQLGRTVIIDEGLMAAATVLGACGIAYAMRFIRANTQGGIEIGFSSSVSQLIAAQTIKGAASLLLETGTHPEEEIDKVTTPQGCTIVGLNEMEHQGFSSSLIKGVLASYGKIDTIAQDF